MRNEKEKLLMLKENVIADKSKQFALRIIKMYEYLIAEKSKLS